MLQHEAGVNVNDTHGTPVMWRKIEAEKLKPGTYQNARV
jgi:hypothetical protein